MNSEMNKVLMMGDNIQWLNLIEWEVAQGQYLKAIKDLKIWCVLKNWACFKKAMKKFESAHDFFCMAYENYQVQFQDHIMACELDYIGRQFEDVMIAVSRSYGKRFQTKLKSDDLPWSRCPWKLDHPMTVNDYCISQFTQTDGTLEGNSERPSPNIDNSLEGHTSIKNSQEGPLD